jgi:hypothetical protein
VRVHGTDDLRTVAFKICTGLHEIGLTVVCTGGSAATVYAPTAYQSRDIDFVLQFNRSSSPNGPQVLEKLGYFEREGVYVHEQNPLTVDFLSQPLSIGHEAITNWTTLEEDRMVLHILSPTDSCRDRLAHFLFWNDRPALSQAVAVARAREVDMKAIQTWCAREGKEAKFKEFERMIQAAGRSLQEP